MAVPSLLSTLTISITPVRPGSRWFGLPPWGLPGLVFATTALSSGLMDGIPFSALVLMVTVTTVLGLLVAIPSMIGYNALVNRIRGMVCLLYTSPSPRDGLLSRMPSSA